MKENIVLSEELYDFFKPEFFSMFQGCNDGPYFLSKHIAALDTTMLTMLALGRAPTLPEVNVVEEITFDRIGYPKCWEENKQLYFLQLKGEYDFED